MSIVYKIVLTGGPGAGKTTSLAHIQDRLESLGFKVFTVPESATQLLNGGFRIDRNNFREHIHFQTSLLKMQLSNEDIFFKAADRYAQRHNKNVVVVCDRGVLDAKGFMTQTEWEAVLDAAGVTNNQLRDKRYDAVIHLESAAVSAPEFYTRANNTARQENVIEAATFDTRIQEAWIGSPRFKVIRSRENFADKMRELDNIITNIVGVPMSVEIERRFLVKEVKSLPVQFQRFHVVQDYLVSSNNLTERVRKRSQDGVSSYSHTIKHPRVNGQCIEEERKIDALEYDSLLTRNDPTRQTIDKHRTCFLHEGKYFELDEYNKPNHNLVILEVELDSTEDKVILPDFIVVEKEITDDDENYSNYNLAKI
jgi:CYTH domain-containing protein/thymidylate kinase